MRVCVVGLGSISRRHIKNLKAIDPIISIGLWRQHNQSRDLGDVQGLVDHIFFSAQEAVGFNPDFAIIANPASMHIETALQFANAGVHCFIEKPLSHHLEGIDQLITIAEEKDLIMMVGYVLRFAKPLRILKDTLDRNVIGRLLSVDISVGQYLPTWRKDDYAKTVSGQRLLGGGAVLELSHEIDYLRYLTGEIDHFKAITARVSDLNIDVEDIAEIQLRTKNGAVGRIHMDMIDRQTHRHCRLIGSQATLLWESEGNNHIVRLISNQEPIILLETENLDSNDMFIDEIKHMMNCVGSKQQPLITLSDAKETLSIALAVLKAGDATGIKLL